jgi:hypothetical protein
MRSLTVGDVTLEFAATGPRITGLRTSGGENLFAEVSDAIIERPGGAPFRLLGGHRLWRAPEVPEITYEPDDDPVVVTEDDGTTTLRGAVDPNGVVREISVTVEGDGTIVVDHRIVNTGPVPIETAPWAITQFPPDGAAVIPIPAANTGYRADRSIVLWPYTDPGAPGIRWGRNAVVIEGGDGSKQKIGTSNTAGWLAWHGGNHVFIKWSPIHDPAMRYVDRGASVQVYRDHRFLELETLGPFRTVASGASIGHRERWWVSETGPIDVDRLPSTIGRLLEASPVGP